MKKERPNLFFGGVGWALVGLVIPR